MVQRICLITEHSFLPKPSQTGSEPPSSPDWKVTMALTLPCRRGIEAGKLVTFPRPQVEPPSPPAQAGTGSTRGREVDMTAWTSLWESALKSQLRVKWQGSDPRTPTLCSSLHPRASYSKEIFFSYLSLPDCFFSFSFPHSKISLFPHHQPSQHRSFCQPMIP